MKNQSKPMRIVNEPVLGGSGRSGNPGWVYTCDDGRDYSRSQLAKIVGITGQQISERLAIYGWQSPRILQSKEAYKEQRMAETRARQAASRAENNGGNEEWKRMGSRVREHNFARIRRPGIYERQVLRHG
ncbi:MAG: hypothetical protein PHZ02_07195 [Desulfocapsaceae bacterium]|nr:hypothetical protein [Desulfocapsaceae bacterium]